MTWPVGEDQKAAENRGRRVVLEGTPGLRRASHVRLQACEYSWMKDKATSNTRSNRIQSYCRFDEPLRRWASVNRVGVMNKTLSLIYMKQISRLIYTKLHGDNVQRKKNVLQWLQVLGSYIREQKLLFTNLIWLSLPLSTLVSHRNSQITFSASDTRARTNIAWRRLHLEVAPVVVLDHVRHLDDELAYTVKDRETCHLSLCDWNYDCINLTVDTYLPCISASTRKHVRTSSPKELNSIRTWCRKRWRKTRNCTWMQ